MLVLVLGLGFIDNNLGHRVSIRSVRISDLEFKVQDLGFAV